VKGAVEGYKKKVFLAKTLHPSLRTNQGIIAKIGRKTWKMGGTYITRSSRKGLENDAGDAGDGFDRGVLIANVAFSACERGLENTRSRRNLRETARAETSGMLATP